VQFCELIPLDLRVGVQRALGLYSVVATIISSSTLTHTTHPPVSLTAAAGTATNVVFIGNLAWSTTEENLRAFASSVGPVLSVQIQAHADTGRSKGWG